MIILSAFLSAFIFGLGLILSGMTNPNKVIGFLDFFHNWDPSLVFVMAGAILAHGLSYRFIKKRKSPFFETSFHIPHHKKIDKKLVLGSIFFGCGWGMSGYCPGPALVSSVSFQTSTLYFIAPMCFGMILFHKIFPS